MGHDAATLTMRNVILQEAAHLFYHQGYNGTSFHDIADVCKITKPLITYHFLNKANLAKEVHAISVQKRKNMVANILFEEYGTYDVQVGTAVELRYYLNQLKEDAKAFRFYHQRLNTSFDDNFTVPSIHLYKAHERRYNLKMNKDIDELVMSAIAAKAAANALNVAYFLGRIKCSFEDFCDYSVSLPFRNMNVSQEEIQEILNKSKEAMERVSFPKVDHTFLL